MKRSKSLLPLILPAALAVAGSAAFAESPGNDWPQWRGAQRDGVWRETGLLEKFPAKGEAKWSVPIGSGYCGPTMADSRVYVMDRVLKPEQAERMHCFDWQSGRKIWTHLYPCTYDGFSYTAGPRCSVLVDDGRAYALGAAGHLFCFDATSGDKIRAHDLDKACDVRIPTWGISASPIIHDDLLIVPVCGKDAYLVAFHKNTGKEAWPAFADRHVFARNDKKLRCVDLSAQ